MSKVMAFARKHRLKVVEDAAHALEAWIREGERLQEGERKGGGEQERENQEYELTDARAKQRATSNKQPATSNQKIGTIGDATCFSFYATKNLTTGEGGMVTCGDAELAAHIRRLSLHGLSHDAWKRYTAAGSWYYEVVERGYKYNLTDIAAALGLAQLAKVEKMWQRRAEIAACYNAVFGEMPELEIPTVNPGIHHAWHLYILRLHLEKLTINRNAFFDELRKRGICCSVHFIPLHLMPYYRKTYGYRPGDFPEAEQQFERVISLPLFPALTDAEVERIIVAVRQVVAESLKRKT
jgi:dTDP-4-amino-4,6-dideoxygalactose transaminase